MDTTCPIVDKVQMDAVVFKLVEILSDVPFSS